MKKLITILLILTALAAVSCKGTVMDLNNPDKSGSVLDLNDPTYDLNFSTIGSNTYNDFQGVSYPVNENGMLTAPVRSDGLYMVPDMPAVFYALQSPNLNLDEPASYNIPFEYTVKFRFTDDTKTIAPGLSPKNAPQGVILPILFLAGEEPYGALMLMVFPTEAFPQTGSGLDLQTGLHENVILVQNYDPDAKTGHVMACADVTGIEAVDPSVDPLDPNLTELEKGIHTVTLRIHNDADETHGPTISAIVNGTKVIQYQNDGTSHTVNPGTWDDDDGALGMTIAGDVLEIDTDYEAFIFDGDTGITNFNSNWQTAMWRPEPSMPEDPMTSVIAMGVMFQIGVKETDAGEGGSGEPGSSKYKCPEIVSVHGQNFTPDPIE